MRLARTGELSVLRHVRARFGGATGRVAIGIGDDAAALVPRPGTRTLASTDMMVEGVHFNLGLCTPYQVGFKLVSANVSDIYAMGGIPEFLLLGLAMPGSTTEAFLDSLLDGVDDASKIYSIKVVGGDVSASPGALVLSAAILGRAVRPVTRGGASAGQGIYVTGTLGDSAAGLALLRRIGRKVTFARALGKPMAWKTMEPLLRRHLMPEARRPAPAVLKCAGAMIDISDGLGLDLQRLCDESGTGARVYADKIPVSPELHEAVQVLGLDPLNLALGGGEDYELLFTSKAGRPRGTTLIGHLTAPGRGMRLIGYDGREKDLRPKGYTHFG